MQKTAVFPAVMVLLLGVFLTSESRRNPVAKIEEGFADWIAANSTHPSPPARVALVEINDSSLGSEHPWPWAPLDFALFMEAALQFNPGVIAIEPVLDWPDAKANHGVPQKQDPYGKILRDFILKAPKVVLGAQLGFPDDPDIATPPLPLPALHHAPGDLGAIPEFTVIERQSGEDCRLSASAGFTNIPAQNNVTHALPMVFRYHGQLVPSLALQAVIDWMKLTPDEVTVEPGSRILLGKTTAVPIDASGGMTVDFQSPVARAGYDDLLLAAADQTAEKPTPTPLSRAIKDGIVLLARTDRDARTLLFPADRKGSPGELCAAAIATIQSQGFSRRASLKCDAALIAAGVAFACWSLRFSRKKTLLVSFFALVDYLILGLIVYSFSLVALPAALPAGMLALVNVFSLFRPREKNGASPAATAA